MNKRAFYVTCDTYVTLTDGTGIVHIAPAFGEDDANVGRKYGLPFVQLVDPKGQMTEETPWAGMFCKDADKEVIKELERKGLLYKVLEFEHSYPHCWRCDTPLLYYARNSWFIKMTAVDVYKRQAQTTREALVAMRLWWLIRFSRAVSISWASMMGATTFTSGS